jgi:pSer/pThr/pTyr-binding forkhead associated (FHA) protein
MKLSLVVLTAGNKMEGKTLEVKLAQFLVGRDPQCHLRPASALISKRHCALLQRDGKAFVRDFDSTNGTFVNDQPVKGELELHNNDQLKIGPLLFAVRLEAGPPINRPTPAPPTKGTAKKPTPRPEATPSPEATLPEQPAGAAPATPPSENKAAEKPAEQPADPPVEKPADEPALAGDEDIAAMLLSLQDDGTGSSGLGDEVPDGSTVHDLAVSPDMIAGKEGGAGKEKKPVKGPEANTSAAAKTILEKYMRRPRSQS